MKYIRLIVIHHSDSPRDSTTLEDIRRWHTDPSRPGGPFDDIGYHFVIEGDGQIRHGRLLPLQGAHARPNNSRIGICITGDNTQPGEEWSTEQLLSGRLLVAALRTVWPGLPVEGHRDVMRHGYTVCPGVDVSELFD